MPAPDADDWDRHWTVFEEWTRANPAQQYRRRLIISLLDLDRARDARILDVGSGIGDLLFDIDARYPRFAKLGLELSQSGVEKSRRRVPAATFLQRDLIAGSDEAGAHRGFATHAVCSEVLEHVDDPLALLRRARDYMAEGCRFVITVPGGPMTAYDRHIGHRRHFSPADLRDLLAAAGFAVERVAGAGFPMFNVYRLLLMWRGDTLIADTHRPPTSLARLALAAFRLAFRLNLPSGPLGWQTVGVAIK